MKLAIIFLVFIPFWVFAEPEADPDAIQADIDRVLADLGPVRIGEVYENEIKGQNPDDFGIVVTLIDGRSFAAGKVDVGLPIMSISKPLAFAVAIEQRGMDFVVRRTGRDASGQPFDDIDTYRMNSLINQGAIAVHSMIDDTQSVLDMYSALAGSPVTLNEEWRATPMPITSATAYMVKSKGRLEGDPNAAAVDYLEACIASVTTRQLARMGAVLANDGVDLDTGERILQSDTVREALSASVTAGMYEDSGSWFAQTGLPAKSGVSGAILAIVPGFGGIATYSPRLDDAGNSVRGALAIKALAQRWGLHSIDRLMP